MKFALLKLMLIEQKHIEQFKQLNDWVMSNPGIAPELLAIESYADGKTKDIGDYKTWNTPDLLKLMAADPKFSDVDLKELFWVSRDNIVEQMSGLSLISTRVRSVFNQAYNAGSDTILEKVCRDEMSSMTESDINEFLDLVDSKILTDPTEKNSFAIYYFCIMQNIEQAYKRLIDVLGRIDVTKMAYSLGNKFRVILERYNQDKKLIDLLSKNGRLMRSITGK